MEFISYDIASMDFRRAGAASRGLKERLKLIGADAEAIRRTMIAAYEAEMNVVIHSAGGRLEASLNSSQVDVNVVDKGPGIPDIERAMTEGFSTASAEARALGFGAGMGLPNIKKNSDRLRLTSRVGEGTRVSFTVYLRPEQTNGVPAISLYASPDRCRDCKACLSACPTRAMRVWDGRPSVLEHLCIDCAECVAACTVRALSLREEVLSLDDIADKHDTLLVVPPALLAGCGPDHSPKQVLAALRSLGFAEVITSEPYEQALRDSAAALAGAAPDVPLPMIVPSCPAVVNLIELRFPSLVPHLAPFDSPWEAVQADRGEQPVAYVVSCPSQRSALLAHTAAAAGKGDGADGGARRAEYLAPEVVRQAVMAALTRGTTQGPSESQATALVPRTAAEPGAAAEPRAASLAPAPDADATVEPLSPLKVTGASHVLAVLDALEDGLLRDVGAIEPYICTGGCFGSPLSSEDHHVAAYRWAQNREAIAAATGPRVAVRPSAVPRRRAVSPRPGIRLDADISRAITKLGRLQAVIDSLPGKDCGACGAPACAALAEDVVMERADTSLCPYFKPGPKEDRDP